ncbi:MAG: peptide chain release factor N(5)-glutamine methyltransferase [bacterium]
MSVANKTWHVLEIIDWSSNYLLQKGITSPRLNAEQLLGHTLNMDRVALYLNYDRPLSTAELARYKRFLKRRLQNEPLQYILGQTEFMSLPFRVNSAVLIPRPETEILVETAIQKCQSDLPNLQTIHILDVGTGSGCIAISLAKYVENTQIVAMDISEAALEVARENACINGVESKIQFLKADFFKLSAENPLSQKFNLIVSNPPYVSEQDFEHLPAEIKKYEPNCALKDGSDGMSYYRALLDSVGGFMAEMGFLIMELGAGQASKVADMFHRQNMTNFQIFKDLNGMERTICCEVNCLA